MLPAGHIDGITVAPLQLLPLLVVALAYARRATTLAAKGRPVPVWRQLCFGAGLAVIVFALARRWARSTRSCSSPI